MNIIAKDQVVWLVDVQTWLVFNIKDVNKENLNGCHKEQPIFNVGDQIWLKWIEHQNIKTFREIALPKTSSIFSSRNKSMLWSFNSIFHIPWISIMCFMFHCWSPTMCPPFQEVSKLPSPMEVNGEQKYKADEILD